VILTVFVVTILLAIAPGDVSADPFQEPSLVRLAKPTRAPDFTVPSLAGGMLAVQEHRGSVVFLNRYAIRGLPGTFLIDRSGDIVAVAIGPRDWDSDPAHAVVKALLK
jgi:peroxiredoxin